jgi:hypothetical protein
MAHKENKGGVLTNEQIEQDRKVTGKDKQPGHYHGMQDTGDNKPRNSNSRDNMKEEVKQQDRDKREEPLP